MKNPGNCNNENEKSKLNKKINFSSPFNQEINMPYCVWVNLQCFATTCVSNVTMRYFLLGAKRNEMYT